jgi:DnaJ-class molecular chaperone
MKEYYKILGVSENASAEEIEIAYKTLKEKYSKDRFLEGEAGNDAAKNLTKLETAYHEIISNKSTSKDEGETMVDYTEVEQAIKDGKFNKAQELLDDITNRGAEWHYLQSVVFYKKNWINESKKQLEIAMNLDPFNDKYSSAYEKLKQKMEFAQKQFHSGNANYQNTSNASSEKQMGGNACGSMAECCMTWLCIDMLCSCCR